MLIDRVYQAYALQRLILARKIDTHLKFSLASAGHHFWEIYRKQLVLD